MPKDVLSKLNGAVVKAVNTPEMKAAFFKQGLEPETNTPEQFVELIRREIEQNIRLAHGGEVEGRRALCGLTDIYDASFLSDVDPRSAGCGD